MKTAGITSSPPGWPAAESLPPATLATAAATMPRGAIHPVSSRSRTLRSLPSVARAIVAGRTAKIIAAVRT